jgi:adenine-specific DNA-methyltransferase
MIRRMGLDVTKHVPARRAAQELSEPLESNRLGSRVAQGAHGVVYTRPWVVEFVLDLAGYDPKENLVDAVVVEPCCGSGEFLEPLVRRLSESCRRQGRPLQDCAASVKAFELDSEALKASRRRAISTLVRCGWDEQESEEAVGGWIRRADFLLEPSPYLQGLGGGVDFVVGNPPYVRLEAISPEVADRYRTLFKSMVGRADLYIGFYEKALSMLKPGGVCGFICADRWMLNQYGSNLRRLVTSEYSVEAVVEMHKADAFHDEVLAYPAVTVIRKGDQGRALVAKLDQDSEVTATTEVLDALRKIRTTNESNRTPAVEGTRAVVVHEWFEGADPWPCVSPERLALLKRLETSFPPMEDAATGTKVSIGVATGADKVFITEDPGLVESERLLPLALAKDTITGRLSWSRHYLVNPWESDGSLVDLDRYSRLRRYFEENESALRGRNVGKKNPDRWYRTIDKVHHNLTAKPKLLIPDIKSVAHPVYDGGTVYPHHNLYHVTSEAWDLKVLGGLLLSRVAQFFIECYAVRMSGGFLRFQAQYLRRIRMPRPSEIDEEQARELSEAFESRDVEAATRLAMELYGIDGIPD